MGKGLEKRVFKTHVERALFCNLNYSHCFQGGRHRQLGSITPESDLKVCLIADRSGKWPSVQSNPCTILKPCFPTSEAGQSTQGWSLKNQQDGQKAILVINWTGTPPIHLIQNWALLCFSPRVDLYPKTFPPLCLLLHSSRFLKSPPTTISLSMKTAYFCFIVLLSCKIPSSSESQDDCSECMESFYQ